MAVYRIRGPNGNEVNLEVPSAAMDQRTFDALVKAGEYTILSGEKPTTEAPPKTGRGSGRDAWATYAESQGFDVADDYARDDIIALVEG